MMLRQTDVFKGDMTRVCILFLALCLTGCAGPLELVSLRKGALHPRIEFEDAAIVADLKDGIVVQTGGKEEWPNITFRARRKPWDLRGYYRVSVDLTNAGKSPVNIGIRLDNLYTNKNDAPQHAQGYELLDPGETRTISVRLSTEDWVFKEPLELHGMRRAPGVELMDISRIDRIQIFVGNTTEPRKFIVRNLRAEGPVKRVAPGDFLPFIDTYGQYKHRDWKRKIHSEDDFVRNRLAEETDIERHPGRWDLGKYGGWTNGPKLEASGAFRVERVNGYWWLVDPEGYLFWSTGPTCISWEFGYTGVEGREDYFEDLPARDGPLAECHSESDWAPHGFYADKVPFGIFQFYRANLIRKYGDDWQTGFQDSVHRRLRSWGMNTIANWAVPNVYRQERTPYVANFFITGNRPLEGSAGYWSPFHDVFDPSFRAAIRKHLEQKEKEARDPWCIGFFVDNELSWGNDGVSIALETLASPADQPAKQEFVRDLKAEYDTVAALNAAWDTNHASWEALLESRKTPDTARTAGDLRRFYGKTADTYFRTVREELALAAPDRLYLGCRFAWVNDVAVAAASRHCDVVSFNKYNHRVRYFRLPAGIDRPTIVGEYHFGATDRGLFHPGLREADNQRHRAEKLKAYVRSALDNPQLVGIHWFQYVDESAAGRADGENYNVGLVDICDTPYPEMVDAIREVGATMYECRSGGGD